MSAKTVSLPSAAQRLGVGYFKARELLFRGALRGELVNGRWLVSAESVEDLAATSPKSPDAIALDKGGGR